LFECKLGTCCINKGLLMPVILLFKNSHVAFCGEFSYHLGFCFVDCACAAERASQRGDQKANGELI